MVLTGPHLACSNFPTTSLINALQKRFHFRRRCKRFARNLHGDFRARKILCQHGRIPVIAAAGRGRQVQRHFVLDDDVNFKHSSRERRECRLSRAPVSITFIRALKIPETSGSRLLGKSARLYVNLLALPPGKNLDSISPAVLGFCVARMAHLR